MNTGARLSGGIAAGGQRREAVDEVARRGREAQTDPTAMDPGGMSAGATGAVDQIEMRGSGSRSQAW